MTYEYVFNFLNTKGDCYANEVKKTDIELPAFNIGQILEFNKIYADGFWEITDQRISLSLTHDIKQFILYLKHLEYYTEPRHLDSSWETT